jgi:hypothetical protein
VPDSVQITSLVSAADLIPDRALREPDIDAFNHDAIAANLAEHVVCAETPLNIALYGPWGSGKSSAFELLRRRLDGKPVKLVHYDASRYGGESLHRNFISHSASELEFKDCEKNRRFHDGMYEGRKSAAVRMPESMSDWKKVGAPLWTLAVTLIGLLLLVALVGFGVSYLTDKSPLNQIAAFIVGLAVPVGVMALLVAAAKAVLDGATVTTEESQPSADEQFRRRFDELVEAARGKHKVDRLVFFIDELDRCTPDDVVKTLVSIKTFLDHDECVFIVAADRDVLEQALTTDLKQATPPNEDNPYYTSASSFLDKVFHHQMFLPPLRKMKLTHFARELVSKRDGLWKELRDEGDQRYLDRVIYALVPSHVVSPRRVKVLLNNFATNARVIQSRGIALADRAPEIAKLTVLQTEFPSLAADLPQEPRLPDLLLDPPENQSPRLKRLLDRHLVHLDSQGLPLQNRSSEPLPETDPLLAPDEDDDEGRQRIAAVQNRDLYRYLRRASGVGITGPARDLLYLEGAGNDHGLDDAALSETIERDALETPETVLAEVTDLPTEDKLAVVGLLCDTSEAEFGDERANVITTLMGVVELLGADVARRAPRVVDALRAFESEQQLDERHLIGALRLGLSLDTGEGRALVGEVSADERLYDDPALVVRAVGLIEEMPDELVKRVGDAVARHTAIDERVLTEALTPLSPAAAERLFELQAVSAAAGARYDALAETDPVAAEALANELYAVGGQHGANGTDFQARIQWLLLPKVLAYPVVRAHAPAVTDGMTPGEQRDSHALRGLAAGGSADWSFWRAYLSGERSTLDWRPKTISTIASRIVAEAQHGEAAATATALAPYVASLDDALAAAVAEKLTAVLDTQTWWNDEAALAEQSQSYDVALALTPDRDTPSGDALRETLAADLRRAARPAPARPGYAAVAAPLGSVSALAAVRELGSRLGRDAHAMAEEVRAILPTGDPQVDAEAARTLLTLARAAAEDGAAVELGDPDVLLAALGSGSRAAEPAASWLRLGADAKVVIAMAKKLGDTRSAALREALSAWAAEHDESVRTGLVEDLLAEQSIATSWIAEVARHGVDDEFLVDLIAERVAAAARHERRGAYIEALLAVAPDGRAAHTKVAKIMLALLERDTKVDFDLALRAAPALGTDHQHSEKLRQAFDRATQDNSFAIPAKSLSELHRAGVRPKQRSAAETAWDLWSSLWGGKRGR